MARGTAPRRQLKWSTDNINTSNVVGTTFLSQLNATLTTAQQEEATLVRTIICLDILPVVPSNDPTNANLVGIGIGVASTAGFGVVGGTADPSVAGEEPLQGWVWKCMYWVRETNGNIADPVMVRMDLRAQRKLGDGVPFLRVTNAAGAGVSFTLRTVGIVRTLYKLA